MTRTLELRPEIESRLQIKATQAGLSLDDYLAELVERDAIEGSTPPVESEEQSEGQSQSAAQPIVLSSDRETRNAQIRALVNAPLAVREATLRAAAAAAAPYYAESLANGGELTEMTVALQGEDFCDD